MINERTLAILVIILATALRLAWLDVPPFSSAEAERGLTALALLNHETPAIWQAPALHTVSVAVALLFGASEITLRAASALAGVLAVGLVWLFRPWLGTPSVLAAQLLMAVSPSLVAYARTLGPEALAQPLLVLLLWSALRVAESGATATFVTAAVCVGLLLNLGPAGISALLLLGTAAALGWALGGRPPQLRARLLEGLVGLLIAFTLAATAILWYPDGFGVPALAAWAAAFDTSDERSLGLLKLAVYEPAVLVAGGLTAAWWLTGGVGRSPLLRALVVWAVGGVVLAAFQSDRTAWPLLSAVLPLTLLAGAGVGALLTGLDRMALRRAAIAAPLLAVLLAYLALALTRQTRSGTESAAAIIVAAGALAAAVLLGLMPTARGRLLPVSSAALLALALAVAADLHTTSRLAFAPGSAEWFDGPRAVPSANAELARLPLFPVGAPPTLTQAAQLAVVEATGPLVRWRLRDRAAVTYVEQVTPGPSLLLGMRPGADGPTDLRGYDAREFPLETSWRPSDATPGRLWRWYVLREPFGSAPLERRAVMYWRS